jgi:antitoxin component YwqK of YwqJK toxin-antitoxin module
MTRRSEAEVEAEAKVEVAGEPSVARYPNGQVKFRGTHLDGAMHGQWEFFRTDGSPMRTGAFDRGRQIGVWRTYDRSGKVIKETTFG